MRVFTLDDLAAYFCMQIRLAQLQIDARYRRRVETALLAIASGRQQAGVSVTLDRVVVDPGRELIRDHILPVSFQRLLRPEIQEISLEFQMLLEQDLPAKSETWVMRLLNRLRRSPNENKAAKHKVSIYWDSGSAPVGMIRVDDILIRRFDVESYRAESHE